MSICLTGPLDATGLSDLSNLCEFTKDRSGSWTRGDLLDGTATPICGSPPLQDLPLPPPRSSSSGGAGGREHLSGGGHGQQAAAAGGGGRSGHRGKRSRHSGTGHSTSHHENPATTSRSGRSGGGGGGGGEIYYPQYDYDRSKYGRVDASCAYSTKYGEDCRYSEKYHEGGGGDREGFHYHVIICYGDRGRQDNSNGMAKGQNAIIHLFPLCPYHPCFLWHWQRALEE